jgi:hypothetical protein
LRSAHPYPFNRCYCSVCRKTAGGGGYAINLGGDADTFEVDGHDHVRIYQAKIRDRKTNTARESLAQRNFCSVCASALWVWDPRWPELIHPFASAIDTELPIPPECTHLMLHAKPSWVVLPADHKDKKFADYPEESIADWHQRLGLVQK